MKYIKLFLFSLAFGFIVMIPKDTYAAPVPGNTKMLVRFNFINDLTVQPLEYAYTEGTYQRFGTGGNGFYVKHMGALLTGIGGVDSNWTYNARVRFIIRGSALDWGDNANFGVVCNQYSTSLSNASSTMISHNRVYLNSGGVRTAIGHEIVCGYAYQSADPTYHEFFLQGNLSYNQGGVVNSNLFNNSPITANTTYFYYDIEEWTADTGNNTIIITQNNTMIAQNESIINGQREINGTLKDDNISGAESDADSLVNNPVFQDTTGLNNIISLPLDFINTIGNTCTPINLTIPFINTNITLPCFSSVLSSKVPTIYNLLVIVINGFILYRCCLDIYGIVKNAKNPNNDRIEVLDL